MNGDRLAATMVVALVAAPFPGSAAELVERFTGTARGTDGAVVYVEDHAVRRDPERLLDATTTYRDASGRTIAVLHTDFSRDPFAPSYSFEDLRSGATEAVTVSPAGVELRNESRSRTLDRSQISHQLVAGQGLDRLVRARLEAIAAGESLLLRYALPSRLDAYDMRVRAAGSSAATVTVRVEFSSWLLRMLAPSLEVEYDRATRRLLRYRGVSNLEDESGANPEVEITYAYPPQAGEASAPLARVPAEGADAAP